MENETKKLSKTSKIILITALVLTIVVVGLFMYFIIGRIFSGNKVVGTMDYEDSEEKCKVKIEVGFEKDKPYVKNIITFETAKETYEAYTSAVALEGLIDLNREVSLNGKELIMEQRDTSEYIGVGQKTIELEKGKVYSKSEQKEILKEAKELLQEQGYDVK